MDSNHRSLSRGSRFILRKVNCAGIDGRPKKFGGVPMVRIDLPPADSLSLSRSRFRRSRTRLSARVWAAGLAIGSAETLGFFDIAPIGGNISVGPNSSTAVRLMWWRDCHAGPNEVGPSLTYGRSLNPDWAQVKPSTIR